MKGSIDKHTYILKAKHNDTIAIGDPIKGGKDDVRDRRKEKNRDYLTDLRTE